MSPVSAPTPLDWPTLLAAAERRGVKVWHINEHGVLVPIDPKLEADDEESR